MAPIPSITATRWRSGIMIRTPLMLIISPRRTRIISTTVVPIRHSPKSKPDKSSNDSSHNGSTFIITIHLLSRCAPRSVPVLGRIGTSREKGCNKYTHDHFSKIFHYSFLPRTFSGVRINNWKCTLCKHSLYNTQIYIHPVSVIYLIGSIAPLA